MAATERLTRALRLRGAALLAGAVLWLLALPLLVLEPAWLPAEQAYGTVVAAAAVLLLVGAGGVRVLLAGRRTGLFAGFTAVWRRLDKVLDPAHDHRVEQGLRDLPGHSMLLRTGLLLLRFGLLLVAVAGVQLAVGGLAWRSAYWLGWFLTYAGAGALGVAIMQTTALPRRAGILLAASALAVVKPASIVIEGRPQQPESLGPVLPLTVGSAWMIAVAAVLWVVFALAWWQIGRVLPREHAPEE